MTSSTRMEVKHLSSYDNYLACNLVITWSKKTTPTTITSEKYCIGKDVMFETRFNMCTTCPTVLYQSVTKTSVSIKFSGPHNIAIRLQCKFLGINKRYAVDDSDWRMIFETDFESPPDLLIYDLDLTFEIEPIIEMPLSFAPLYEDTVLTDFELHGEDGSSVQIHSAALAASSPALRRMLEGKWTETQDRTLKIPKTSKATLQDLKDFIYLGVLPETGVENLLLLASCYMMDDLQDKCITHIIKTLKADKVAVLSIFAIENNLNKLYWSILECIQKGLISVKDIKQDQK